MLVLQASPSLRDTAKLAVIYMGRNKVKTITVLDQSFVTVFNLGEGNKLSIESRI